MRYLIFIVIGAILFGITGCCENENTLKLMSFNVRYDNPDDEPNNWKNRKVLVTEIINERNIDVLGAQEVLHNQLLDILDACPQYAYVGVGRLDGVTKGEYSPILYNKNKFALEKSGYFWLSETPDIAGAVGWDAACERIVTWAILKKKDTGADFAFFNTHFDHVGKVARKESAILMNNKINQLAGSMPAIITGDFNVPTESEAIKTFTAQGKLVLAKDIATKVSGPEWSFHDFGELSEAQRPLIDHILVNKQVEVLNYENIFKSDNDLFLSDHNPLILQVTF